MVVNELCTITFLSTIYHRTTESTGTLPSAFPSVQITINDSFWIAGLITYNKRHSTVTYNYLHLETSYWQHQQNRQTFCYNRPTEFFTVFTDNNITAYWQTTNNTSTSLTNQVNNQRHIYHLLTFYDSLDSEDDFRSGCGNVSQSHLKQSFSGLDSPGWS